MIRGRDATESPFGRFANHSLRMETGKTTVIFPVNPVRRVDTFIAGVYQQDRPMEVWNHEIM